MLSKNMTVSLMSLITIFALAFVVTPAMALTVFLDTADDDSDAAGYQRVHPGDDQELPLKVEFELAVILAKESVQIVTLDKDGKLLSLQKFPAAAETAANAGREKTFKPKVGKAARTVMLLVPKDIASADPFDAATVKTKEYKATIDLIGLDDGPPTVYSISRAVDDTHTFAKISPKTDPVVEVRVILSELPKAFTTSHISATEATVTSVRQLLPVTGRDFTRFRARPCRR